MQLNISLTWSRMDMVPEEAGPAGLKLEWAQHLPFVRVLEQPELDRGFNIV